MIQLTLRPANRRSITDADQTLIAVFASGADTVRINETDLAPGESVSVPLDIGVNVITAAAENDAGETAESSVEVLRLITGRTEADVAALERLYARSMEAWTAEETAWFNAAILRGSYGWTDLNRVTAALERLHGALTALGYVTGYRVLEIEPGRSEWLEGDHMNPSRGAAYLANVRRLLDVFGLYSTAPALAGAAQAGITRLGDNGVRIPDSMRFLGTTEANAIEEALLRVEDVRARVQDSVWYSGEIYAGEV